MGRGDSCCCISERALPRKRALQVSPATVVSKSECGELRGRIAEREKAKWKGYG